jgi:hypothetical protein
MLEHFQKYLYGQEFHLGTDHSTLTWLSFKNLDGQTARWIHSLQEYNFTDEHRQGRKRNNADALSWWPCQEECTHCHTVEAWADVKQVRAIAAVAAAALRKELNYQDIGPILEEVETGKRTEWKDVAYRSPTYKGYCVQWKSLTVRNGILQRHWESVDGQKK